ncbi:hypothetical protein, partial [Streptomyces sp. NK08204]|uniref:CurL C-terminal domain-containing protein n=1 Tax=Streptomyces sp. NK08204 TaxID=2873260 RepID=UPI001CED2397
MILEQAPEVVEAPVEAAEPVVPGAVVPWVLSAKSEDALRAQAGRLLPVAGGGSHIGDVAFSLVSSRSVFERRAVVLARD